MTYIGCRAIFSTERCEGDQFGNSLLYICQNQTYLLGELSKDISKRRIIHKGNHVTIARSRTVRGRSTNVLQNFGSNFLSRIEITEKLVSYRA